MLRAAAGYQAPAPANTDPQFNYVSMLLHGDGTNGSQNNTFVDSSANNFTITRNGNTTQGSFSPFTLTGIYSTSTNGGSGYFDGNGDWLSLTLSAATGSTFTVEAWVYLRAYPATGGSGGIVSTTNTANSPDGWFFRVLDDGRISFAETWGANQVLSTATVPLNTWTHVAGVRNGSGAGNAKIYVNGVLQTSTGTFNKTYSSTQAVIGRAYTNDNIEYLNGYISNVRVTSTAVYTATFTPPTAPLTAISGTSLLLNFTNAGIFDNAAENDLETVGNAQISTGVKKYGTGSIAFDGTGDWLLVPDNTNLQLGSGSFTVEGWVNLALLGSARGLVSKGTSTTGWSLSVNSLNQVVFTDATTAITTTTALMANTWYHVAVVRSGTGTNQTVIYIDGVSSATGTSASNFNQTGVMYVGADRTGGSALNGYIDDLRITKGYARYTANFTPPTAAFPDQ
jgi:hypothetical protein